MQATQSPTCIHIYDQEQYSRCPFCGSDSVEATKPFTNPSNNDVKPTVDIDAGNKQQATNETKRYGGIPTTDNSKESVQPVVGWLVCVEGVNKGRDYRISSGYNSIGRSNVMRIHISGDGGISEDHATLLFDYKSKLYLLERTKATNPIRINENLLMSPRELNPYDLIDFGETKLLFVPLCGEHFSWS